MKKPVITVVGSYAVGMTMRSARFPTCGETLIGHNFRKLHGGKGSNQAVGCARLGAEVQLIACIGQDAFGDEALALYKKEGIDTSGILCTNKLATGVGFIIVNDHGHNIITLDMGANQELTDEYVHQMKHVIARSDVLLMQLEIPVQAVQAASDIAAQAGVKTILNPAPYRHLPESVWENITIATPNEKEAKLSLGYGPEEDVSLDILADGLMNKGVKDVIITLGDRGAYFATCQSCSKHKLFPVRKVDVVDTTGAGDTFSAALGVAIGEGKSLENAIHFASEAAAVCVTKYGVIESMPYRHEIFERV